jgi:MFS family permease
VVLLTGILGTVIGGVAADVSQRSKGRGALLLSAIIAAVVSVPSALFPVMPGVTSVALALGALLLAGSVTAMVASVALTVWLPNELRGLCIGAFIAIAGLIGFGISPTLVTLVSTMLGGEQHLAPALAIVGTMVSLLSVGGFVMAMRNAPAGPAAPTNDPIG